MRTTIMNLWRLWASRASKSDWILFWIWCVILVLDISGVLSPADSNNVGWCLIGYLLGICVEHAYGKRRV